MVATWKKHFENMVHDYNEDVLVNRMNTADKALKPTTQDGVKTALNELRKKNKATGKDEIPVELL